MNYKSIDKSILKSIPNPNKREYEIEINIPEFTCLGNEEKPDFGHVKIAYVPSEKIIELKSLKSYFYQYRDIIISYERLINVLYEHLTEIYDPVSIVIVIDFMPRGGISSKVKIRDIERKQK